LLAVMVLMAGAFWLAQRDREAIHQRIGPFMEGCRQMERLANELLEDQFILLKDPGARPHAVAQFARHGLEFDAALRQTVEHARSPDARQALAGIRTKYDQALAGQRRLEALVAAGDRAGAMGEHRALAEPIMGIRDDANTLYMRGIQAVTRMDDEALERGSVAFGLAFVIALVGAAIAAYQWRQTSQDVVEPLRALQRAADELAQGRFIQAHHPRVARVAELAAMQEAFNRMTARLQDAARNLVEANMRLEEQVAERTAELQRLVEELRTLDRLKSDFLATVSHELLTPLNFIVAFGSTLEDEVQGPLTPGQRDTVAKMMAGADRLTRMVRNTLEYTQLQTGELPVNPQAVDYAHMLDGLQAELTPRLAARGQVLDLALPAELPRVQADPDRLLQVLEELLDNAAKFSPPGARLRVGVEVGPDVLTTEVADPGEGIPEEALPKLFMPFYQVNSTRTREHTGMGLGLAIAYHLVVRMGGAMLVGSRPGHGTTIRFTLPRAVRAAAPLPGRHTTGTNP
jgi:signal transduction histidine kinase